VLIEINIVASNAEAAIRHAVETEWVPGAIALRVINLEGEEIFERTKFERT
jgi:hypothetical protein